MIKLKMSLFPLSIIALLISCSPLTPEIFKTIDDIATDDAISIQVDRNAFKKNTDVHITVDVLNRDIKQIP